MGAYLGALGGFLHSYASAEAGLLFLIDRYAGGLLADDVNQATPPTEFWARTRRQMDVVRALVGSQRSAVMSDTIKLLLRVAERPPADRQIADEALAQFARIGVIRNRLVHSGGYPFYDGEWLFRTWNGHEVKERTKAQDYVFSIEDLENMVSDLHSVRLRIAAVTLTDNTGFEAFATEHGAFRPWSYKPIQPVAPAHTQKRIRESGHPLPRSPFEAAFSIAASYPMTEGGPLAYSGKPRV
jgi:hypothetical protein